MKTKVAIIGAGSLGNALGNAPGMNYVEVRMWDKNPEKVARQKSLEETLKDADAVFLCVPAYAYPEIIKFASPFLGCAVVISMAKGMIPSETALTAEFLKKALPADHPFAIMSGPMIAEDITRGKPCSAVVAADRPSFELVSGIFAKTNITTEHSTDTFSVSLAGVLKNIYTLAVGIYAGLGRPESDQRELAEACLAEMTQAAEALKADKKIVLGTAGKKDLLVTAFSPYSKNRQTGVKTAKDGKPYFESEGATSLPILLTRLRESAETLPILRKLKDVFVDKRPASKVF